MRRDPRNACPVCRGSQFVRLPLYLPVQTVFYGSDIPAIAEANHRDYPCPECADVVSTDRVAILEAHAMVDATIKDPGFQKHMRESVAHQLIGELLSGGYISFKEGPVDSDYRYSIVVTLGVVSKSNVASMRQRIEQGKDRIVRAIVDELIRSSSISSASANQLVSRALEKAEKREKINENHC